MCSAICRAHNLGSGAEWTRKEPALESSVCLINAISNPQTQHSQYRLNVFLFLIVCLMTIEHPAPVIRSGSQGGESVFLFNVKFSHKTHLHCGRPESCSVGCCCCRARALTLIALFTLHRDQENSRDYFIIEEPKFSTQCFENSKNNNAA